MALDGAGMQDGDGTQDGEVSTVLIGDLAGTILSGMEAFIALLFMLDFTEEVFTKDSIDTITAEVLEDRIDMRIAVDIEIHMRNQEVVLPIIIQDQDITPDLEVLQNMEEAEGTLTKGVSLQIQEVEQDLVTTIIIHVITAQALDRHIQEVEAVLADTLELPDQEAVHPQAEVEDILHLDPAVEALDTLEEALLEAADILALVEADQEVVVTEAEEEAEAEVKSSKFLDRKPDQHHITFKNV